MPCRCRSLQAQHDAVAAQAQSDKASLMEAISMLIDVIKSDQYAIADLEGEVAQLKEQLGRGQQGSQQGLQELGQAEGGSAAVLQEQQGAADAQRGAGDAASAGAAAGLVLQQEPCSKELQAAVRQMAEENKALRVRLALLEVQHRSQQQQQQQGTDLQLAAASAPSSGADNSSSQGAAVPGGAALAEPTATHHTGSTTWSDLDPSSLLRHGEATSSATAGPAVRSATDEQQLSQLLKSITKRPQAAHASQPAQHSSSSSRPAGGAPASAMPDSLSGDKLKQLLRAAQKLHRDYNRCKQELQQERAAKAAQQRKH